MDWDRTRRFDDHRGGESYRPASSRTYSRRSRSPPRVRSPPSRLVADTWVPSTGRVYSRIRSRSPDPFRRRASRSPQPYNRDAGAGLYSKVYSPRRFSPRRDVRPRSPLSSSRRPRSPYGEDRARDIGWSRSNSRHPRDLSPPGRDAGYYRRERRLPSAGPYTGSGSLSRHGPSAEDDQRRTMTPRARSPFYGGRREHTAERFSGQRRRSPSPIDATAKRPSAPGSVSTSRRPSPHHDKSTTAPRGTRSRSPPGSHFAARCLSRDPSTSSGYDERRTLTRNRLDTPKAKSISPVRDQDTTKHASNQDDAGFSRPLEMQVKTNHVNASYPSNVPSQPRAFSRNNQSPPPGPPHGPKTLPSHSRASNISLLSAPTRPRGNASFKDSGWAGTPIRRGPARIGSHGTPIGPRSNQSSAPGVEVQRPNSYRQNSTSGASSPHTQRYPKPVIGLNTIIPGGKLLPSELDPVTEKRLSQLDTDKDRLFEQTAENQKLKRGGLRDWDRFDRESSICALKSELAEGHLQCITETEGALGRAMF